MIDTQIKSYCKIENGVVTVNGTAVYQDVSDSFADFAKGTYKSIGMKYPKFFKMDGLSKLALIAAEAVLKEVSEDEKEEIALVFANKSSSLDTDMTYQDSIDHVDNYFPSPAVFVYTLPNICLGEISIKHQLKSEHAFYIFDTFDAKFMKQYAEVLIQNQKANKVLCGWVEYYQGEYKALVYLVDTKGNTEHTIENLEQLYK